MEKMMSYGSIEGKILAVLSQFHLKMYIILYGEGIIHQFYKKYSFIYVAGNNFPSKNKFASFTSVSQAIFIYGCVVKSINLLAWISGSPFVLIAEPIMQQYVPTNSFRL